jgi:hypothetical protein
MLRGESLERSLVWSRVSMISAAVCAGKCVTLEILQGDRLASRD